MKRLLFAALLAAPLAGCGVDHYAVRGLPTVSAGPVAESERTPVFLDAVEDRSGGVMRPAAPGSAQLEPQGVFDPPLAPVLREAVEEQLRQLRVPLAASADQAPRALSLALTSAIVHTMDSGLLVTELADVKLEATVKDASGQVLASQALHGKSQFKPTGIGPMAPGFQQAVEGALAEALSKIGEVLAAAGPGQAAEMPAAARRATEESSTASRRSDIDDVPKSGAHHRGQAIIIGVEHYREKLPNANFAVSDARLTAEYAERVLGFPEQNVAVLTDDHATRGDFEKYFERWLPNRVEPGDEVFVYYSGHGAPDPKTGDSFLVPYDADPTYIQETGYPLKKLYSGLAKLPAKRIVVALDSCFSGAGGRSVIARGSRPLVSVRSADVPANVVVLAASDADQISNSYEQKGHGLFTYFLLRGLKQSSDLDAAFDYAAPQVAKVARRELNADQTPVRRGK